jgi:hypothetical protein
MVEPTPKKTSGKTLTPRRSVHVPSRLVFDEGEPLPQAIDLIRLAVRYGYKICLHAARLKRREATKLALRLIKASVDPETYRMYPVYIDVSVAEDCGRADIVLCECRTLEESHTVFVKRHSELAHSDDATVDEQENGQEKS